MPNLISLSARRILLALLCALAVALVAYFRGYGSFTQVRLGLVTQLTDVPTGTLVLRRVMVDDEDGPLFPPFAIVGLASAGDERAIEVLIDGQSVCSVQIDSPQARRFDCNVREPWDPFAEHEMVLRSTGAWSLHFVEIATHHGGSRGLFELFVVPKGSPAPVPSLLVSLALALLAGSTCLAQRRPLARVARQVHWTLCALVGAVLVVTIVSPVLTDFVIVLGYRTLVVLLAVALAPQALGLARVLAMTGERESDRAPRRALRVALVGVTVGVVFWQVTSSRIEQSAGNHSGLLLISQGFFDSNPLFEGRTDVRDAIAFNDDGGYDAQFMFAMTFDPLLQAFDDSPEQYLNVVDAPAYRFGRIGFAWLTYALSFGRWQLFAPVMVWLVPIGGVLTACGLALCAAHCRRPIALGLLVLLIPGFWLSIQVGLPEPIAAALLVAGYLFFTRAQLAASALLLGASLLVRETGAILVLCLAFSLWRRENSRLALAWLAAVVLPTVGWRLYAGLTFAKVLGLQGFFQNPRDFGPPFAGLAELVWMSWTGNYYSGVDQLARAGLWFPFLVLAGVVVTARLLWLRRDALSVAACGYAWVAASLNFPAIWVHVGNGQRGTYETFLLIALLTATRGIQGSHDRRLVWSFWAFAGIYTLWASADAEFLRASLW